jgi:hypothetical protein
MAELVLGTGVFSGRDQSCPHFYHLGTSQVSFDTPRLVSFQVIQEIGLLDFDLHGNADL